MSTKSEVTSQAPTSVLLHKYRTHGNDYIIIDNRTGSYDALMLDEYIKQLLCDRIFGLGAIGINEIRAGDIADGGIAADAAAFEIVYHLGTGVKGKACGTGTRCTLSFARDTGIVAEDAKDIKYRTCEGEMDAKISSAGEITQSMSNDCSLVCQYNTDEFYVDVAWAVHVRFISDGIWTHDIVKEGLAETDTEKYSKMQSPTYILGEVVQPFVIKMRSFDRTAKDYEEMYACGTGGMATCIAYLNKHSLMGRHTFKLVWKHGITTANITRTGNNEYSDLEMSGFARHAYSSTVNLEEFRINCQFFEKQRNAVPS